METLLVSSTVITTDSQMGKFQENISQVMGPLSRLWKGLEYVPNESFEAVEVPLDTFATLIEQTTLLLGQASLSISYAHCLNILKILLKDPRKAKTLLKEKTILLQEDEGHLFGKKFRSHIIETERSKKSLWKVLREIMRKMHPFKKILYLIKIDRKEETKTKMFDFKTVGVQVPESTIMQVQHQMVNTSFIIQKVFSCNQQFRTDSTNKDCNFRACASSNKKIIYKKCTISRKASLLHGSLGKDYSG